MELQNRRQPICGINQCLVGLCRRRPENSWIGPPGFVGGFPLNPGPPVIGLGVRRPSVPPGAVYSRALLGATVRGGVSLFLCIFKLFRVVGVFWRCWGLVARAFGAIDALLLGLQRHLNLHKRLLSRLAQRLGGPLHVLNCLFEVSHLCQRGEGDNGI